MRNENEQRAWDMFAKSVGPSIWTGKDLGKFFAAGVLLGVLICLPIVAIADNEITIDQTGGTDLAISIEQIGSKNAIKMYDSGSSLNGANMSLHLYQASQGTYQNTIELWHLDGSNNNVRWGQGGKLSSSTDTTFSYDGLESGGHYANLDIHGNDNNVSGWQANSGNGAHTYNQLIWSDGNSVYVEQRGNIDKTLNLTIKNDDNTVEVVQREYGHSATIELDGTDPTNLNLLQQGGTNQSYTLYQNCVTVGGCNVSVVQQ